MSPIFKLYVDKVLQILKRQLTQSELEIVQDKFTKGWNCKATAEYLNY